MKVHPGLAAAMERDPSGRFAVAVYFDADPPVERLRSLGLAGLEGQPAMGTIDAAQIHRLEAQDDVQRIELMPPHQPT